MNNKINKITALSGLVAAGAVAAAILAPQAQATPYTYISHLANSDQAEFDGPTSSFLDVGYRVCADVAAGWSRNSIINTLYWNHNFDWTAAREVYDTAVNELC